MEVKLHGGPNTRPLKRPVMRCGSVSYTHLDVYKRQVSTVYLMFGQAWNMSSITEDDSDDRDSFYENVFDRCV